MQIESILLASGRSTLENCIDVEADSVCSLRRIFLMQALKISPNQGKANIELDEGTLRAIQRSFVERSLFGVIQRRGPLKTTCNNNKD